MPFLQELIRGDDGGALVASNAISDEQQLPSGSGCNVSSDILGEMNIPPILSVFKTPLDTKVESEGPQDHIRSPDITSCAIDGDKGPITLPFDQTLGDDHGIGLCSNTRIDVDKNNCGENPFSPETRIFDLGSTSVGDDLSRNKSKKKRRKRSRIIGP